MSDFSALVLDDDNGKVSSSLRRLTVDDLPTGDVTVRVEWTTLNYKDGLILNGLGRLVRQYPHIPGIDFAGTVEQSDSPDFRPGDKVILTGWRVGEVHWGGYAQMARVKSDWLVRLPDGMTTRQAMALGTAGLTAMLAVMALEDHGLTPDQDGDVLVTGAVGGLGSIATIILAQRGYRVTASTGRTSQYEYLAGLGAKAIINRSELAVGAIKPLLGERWLGAVDSVGGATLAHVLSSLRLHGSVAACGNAGGVDLDTSVLPFLLRGINLLGIDSAQCPTPRRAAAWAKLATLVPPQALDQVTSEAGLSNLPELAGKILKGDIRGRVVIDVNR